MPEQKDWPRRFTPKGDTLLGPGKEQGKQENQLVFYPKQADKKLSKYFTQHQYIMFRHHDANHPHIHILMNRIGYDGKVLSDSNDFARCEEILRRLEKKYNVSEVISSRQARERAVTKNELEMVKRTTIPP